MDSLANRYASALLSIAIDEGKNEAYRNYVKDVLKAIEENSSFVDFLNSAFISKDEKIDAINKVFVDCPFPYFKSFLGVIIDNSRSHEIVSILKEFISISNEFDSIAEGTIYSTIKLSNDQIERISKAIETKIKRKVYLVNKIDESLIGGVKVVISDYIFDGSLNYKVTKLKNSLLEGNN